MVKIDDDAEVELSSKPQVLRYQVGRLTQLLFGEAQVDVMSLISKHPNCVVCINPDATVWKVFQTKKAFMSDSEAMKYY